MKRLKTVETPLSNTAAPLYNENLKELSVSSSSESSSESGDSEADLQLGLDPPEALSRLKIEKWYTDQIRPVESDPGCEARCEEVSSVLSAALSETIMSSYKKVGCCSELMRITMVDIRSFIGNDRMRRSPLQAA